MNETEKIAKMLRTIMLDPTRVAIWFEILRKPHITAYELMKVINIKKTAMYYHLNLLEAEGILKVKVVKKQKHYEVLVNFFELYQAAKEFLKDKHRDLDIFSLLIISSFIQRELNKLMNMSKDEYQKRKYPITYSGMWFTNREKMEQIRNEYKKLYDKIMELDKGEGPDTVAHTPLAYYWGIMDFE